MYEVVVGNIGTVYGGDNRDEAKKAYRTYRELSKAGVGRGAGESVTLFEDGHIIQEYLGTIDLHEQESGTP